MKTQSRISRDQLFLDIASLFGLRSTCPRAQVGAVATQSGRIVATGYNGAPAGMPHCTDVDCKLEFIRPGLPNEDVEVHDEEEYVGHCTRTVHAEANAIAWAARTGVPLAGAELYLTHTPCETCAKLIINAGIQAVHFVHDYGHDSGMKLLYEAKVQVFESSPRST